MPSIGVGGRAQLCSPIPGVAALPVTQSAVPSPVRELKGVTGLIVEKATGPARRAGIQAGDLLLSINGVALKSPEDLRTHVANAGKSAALLVQREDRQLFVPVELG